EALNNRECLVDCSHCLAVLLSSRFLGGPSRRFILFEDTSRHSGIAGDAERHATRCGDRLNLASGDELRRYILEILLPTHDGRHRHHITVSLENYASHR
ncbi:TPA: hypothetical protein ACX6DP_003684, partial [Vibrio cholerae]